MKALGIVGAGTMGSGIAQVAAQHGHPVWLVDNNDEALAKSRSQLDKILGRLVEKGKITESRAEEIRGNITYTTDLSKLTDCSLVIEAIVERLEVKQSLFGKLEEWVSAECILASNTSSLSIASIAGSLKNPGRVIGIHFFNPAPLMPLVEIVPAVQTTEKTLSASLDIIKSWGKTTVVAKDTPGFIVNRVARPFYGEALRIYEEGLADIPTIDWAMKEIGGFRMGPFELMDYIGNDVNYTVTETVWKAFYYDPRYKPSFTQKRMMEAGYLGRKSGRGYYDYTSGQPVATLGADRKIAEAVFERILAMLINEAADALFWGIASATDIDLAMTKGVNYPKGLLKWADELGAGKVLETIDYLYDRYREDRYRASALLRDKALNGEKFF